MCHDLGQKEILAQQLSRIRQVGTRVPATNSLVSYNINSSPDHCPNITLDILSIASEWDQKGVYCPLRAADANSTHDGAPFMRAELFSVKSKDGTIAGDAILFGMTLQPWNRQATAQSPPTDEPDDT